jgi:serine/threonine protein kinase
VPPLEEGLSVHLGRKVRVAALEGGLLEAQSTHPIDRLRVTLTSGETVSVIFKRLVPRPRSKGGRREVLIYRRLLAGQRFGAPALYGSVYDSGRDCYWLFLEDVGEESLGGGDREHWLAAARKLAEVHAAYHGREEELRAMACLQEHGPAYYHMLAGDARRHLRQAAGRRALARFDRLMARFDAAVAFLVRQPRTLVHGDVFPDNFLFQSGPRVRLIDWEEAAVGLGAWDLARLLDGWGSDKPTFVAAYLAEFARRSGGRKPPERRPLDEQAFHRTFAHGKILNVLWHLGWDAEACSDAAFVNGLLDELEGGWRVLWERMPLLSRSPTGAASSPTSGGNGRV